MGSPSVSPINTMVDWSDSHYQYVKSRVQAVNSNRQFGGIYTASDWPSQEMKLDTFYLIIANLLPIKGTPAGTGANSASSALYGERIQWVWSIIGQDIQPDSLATNRGTRYRTQFRMVQELTHGFFPNFCEKREWSIQDTELVSTGYTPMENVWFSKPEFSERLEKSTGILFGSATSVVTGFSPTILG